MVFQKYYQVQIKLQKQLLAHRIRYLIFKFYRYYLSPEIIENSPYTFKTDVWSLGVLLYEMCALKPPFEANSLHMLALKIVRGVYP